MIRIESQKIRRWFVYALIVAGAFLLFFLGLRPAPLIVEVATISRSEFVQQVVEDAKTRARDVFVVTALVPGTLKRVTWDPGDRIKKGDIVASIFPNVSELLDKRTEGEVKEHIQSLLASAERAKVIVESASVAYKTATSDYERNRALVKKGYVSKSDFEHIELQMDLRKKEYESAQFNAKAAEHEVEQARVTLEQIHSGKILNDEHSIKVFSPVDGQVLKVDHESEGPIKAGEPILTIANVADLEIVSDILSTDAVKIKAGDPVLIEHWGGNVPLKGKVRLVEPGGFMKISALGVEEQRVNVVIDITSPRELWKNLGAEFRVDVAVLIYKVENVLQVPISALFRHHNHWAVFVVENNKAQLREIQISHRNTQAAILTSGLHAGEKVILYPGERVTDGVRVSS